MSMEKNEIICISSDDEEPLPKKGSYKRIPDKSEKVHNNGSTNVKLEALLDNDRSKENNKLKRKMTESSGHSEKKIKLSSSTMINCNKVDINSNASECNIADMKKLEDKNTLMPLLTVKEVKSVARVEQDPFPMFLSLCLQKDHSEDMKTIVNKLKIRYDLLDQAYANSEAFIDFLNQKRTEIMNSRNELYKYIKDVKEEMKNSCKGRSALLNRKKDCKTKVPSSNDSVSNSNLVNEDVENTVSENETDDPTRVKQLKIVLKAMNDCEKRIKKYETAEIDFDDENNSNYIKVEKYKHRMVELYNKYCEYTGANTDAERSYLRPKHFSTTGIVAVDQAITSFINSKISARNKKVGSFTKFIMFPDYTDILQCISKCNDLHNLGLDKKKQEQIAKKAFLNLGEHLQRDRRNDYWDTFSLYLENKEEDPALKDPSLAEKLSQNKRDGDKRMSNIFEEYVKKQEERKDQLCEEETTSVEDNDEGNSSESEVEDSTEEASTSDVRLSIENEELNEDEEESNTDAIEIPTNEPETSANNEHGLSEGKPISNVIEKTSKKICIEDESKLNEDDTLNSREMNSSSVVSNSESNTNSEESIKENGAIPPIETSSIVVPSTNVAQTSAVDSHKAEEDVPNYVCEMKNKPLEEDKPLLRVRSFAKPPTTWEDGQEKVNATTDDCAPLADSKEVIIDLTSEVQNQSRITSKCGTVPLRNKTISLAKGKIAKVGGGIISVKHITTKVIPMCGIITVKKAINYVKTRTVESNNSSRTQHRLVSIRPGAGAGNRSTVIRLPPASSVNQQTTSAIRSIQVSQNNTIIQIPATCKYTVSRNDGTHGLQTTTMKSSKSEQK